LLRHETIEYKKAKIHYYTKGRGKAVVLLHGLLESSEIWRDYVKTLSKKYKVFAIDLPGHGKSESIGYVHSMEMMADVVHHILKTHRYKYAVLVGHSMGGYVCMAFAEKYPDSTKGVCLFHSHAAADNELKKKDRERMIEAVKQNHKKVIQHLIPNLFTPASRTQFKEEIQQLVKTGLKTTKRGFIAALQGMKDRIDREIVLRFAHFPILYIIGREDPVINLEQALEQASRPRDIKTIVLDNVAHMGFIEAHDVCLEEIKKFVQRAHRLKTRV
jgi:pimeloyl-ACP methyl ester carboxylesterase